MLNKGRAILRIYLGIIAFVVFIYLLFKNRGQTMSFHQITAIIFLMTLVINYLVYQILKAISDFKNNYRKLTIMYCLTILLTVLFFINIFIVSPNKQFLGLHGFWGASTLLIALLFSIHDLILMVINTIKKV